MLVIRNATALGPHNLQIDAHFKHFLIRHRQMHTDIYDHGHTRSGTGQTHYHTLGTQFTTILLHKAKYVRWICAALPPASRPRLQLQHMVASLRHVRNRFSHSNNVFVSHSKSLAVVDFFKVRNNSPAASLSTQRNR